MAEDPLDPMTSRQTLSVEERVAQLHTPMPRRAPIATSKNENHLSPSRMSERVGGKAHLLPTLGRLAHWVRISLLYGTDLVRDSFGGEREKRKPDRQRRALVRLGPYASRLGMQLSMRLDLLPLESCNALATLSDPMPPLDLEVAMGLVKESVGKPLHEVFQQIDPEPIASTTVGCIYQAVHVNGEKVIINVRPPQAADRFATEIRAISLLFWLLEAATVVRPGFFRILEQELYDMVGDELDYIGVARYHRLFRREVRRSNLKRVTAGRVYHELSGRDVIVKEFLSGVWLSEVIAAVESGDLAALGQMYARGIDPERVSRDLLEASWWGLFESYFFYTEPRADNIVIREGGIIAFTSLANCSRCSSKSARLQKHVYERLTRNDVAGAAEVMVQWMTPLPLLDVDDLTKSVEGRLWPRLFALRDRKAKWVDRTTVGVWRALLKTMRENRATVRLDSVHMMRSAMLFDLLAARLHPKVDLLKEFTRYEERARRRSARRARRQVRKLLGNGVADAAMARVEEVTDGVERMAFWLETLSRDLPVKFMSMSNKGAYVASVLIKFGGGAVVLLALLSAALLSWQWWTTGQTSMTQSAGWVLTHPAVIGLVVLLGIAAARRIAIRLDDKDND